MKASSAGIGGTLKAEGLEPMMGNAKTQMRRKLSRQGSTRSASLWWILAVLVLVATISSISEDAVAVRGPSDLILEGHQDSHRRIQQALHRLDAQVSPDKVSSQDIKSEALKKMAQSHYQGRSVGVSNLWANDTRTLFVAGSGLTAVGQALVQACKELEAHGVKPERFRVPLLREQLSLLFQRGGVSVGPVVPPHLSSASMRRLLEWMASNSSLPSPQHIADELSSEASHKRFPQFAAEVSRLSSLRRARALSLADAELILVEVLSRYLENVVPNFSELAMMNWFESFRSSKNAPEALAQLRRLLPSHQEYRGLQSELTRYRSLARQGGWESLALDDAPAFTGLGPLDALTERLRVEGDLGGNDMKDGQDPRGQLIEGIRLARLRYGMSEGGGWDEALQSALNVPIEQRVAQLEGSLARWRAVPIEPLGTYLRLNLPTGEGELVRGGVRVFAFRLQRAPEGFVGATHITSARFEETGAVTLTTQGEVHKDLSLTLGGNVAATLATVIGRLVGEACQSAACELELNPNLPLYVTSMGVVSGGVGRGVKFYELPQEVEVQVGEEQQAEMAVRLSL